MVRSAVAGMLADVVALLHAAFLAFLVVGGFLAWRWPRLIVVHVPVVAWAVAIVTVRFDCPLTPVEKELRAAAGEPVYTGPFIDHYLRDRVFPSEYETATRAVVVGAVVVAWAGFALRRRRAPGGRAARAARPSDARR